MPRLFIAIDLPATIREGLFGLGSGIPGSRSVPIEQLHLTLKFIGDIESGKLPVIRETLQEIQFSPLPLVLAGVGHFPLRGNPTVLWVGVKPSDALVVLQKRIENSLYHRGIPREGRKFFPHVTVARLNHSPAQRIAQFLAGNNLLISPEFTADSFTLYASSLTPKGAVHTPQHSYLLE